MLERSNTQFVLAHNRNRWSVTWDRTRFGGDLQLVFENQPILRDVRLYLDDVGSETAAGVANRAVRRGGVAVVEEEASLPADPPLYARRTWRYAANRVRVAVDLGWPPGREVRRHFGADALFLPGAWKRMFFLRPAPVHSNSRCELRSVDLPPPPETGAIMVAHTHRAPPVLAFVRRGGLRIEIGTGADLWRWDRALGAGPENGSWKVLLSARGLQLIREPLMTCTGFTPEPRPYRFTWYAAWSAKRRARRSPERSLFPLEITRDGRIQNLHDAPRRPIPRIALDFAALHVPEAWTRAPTMADWLRGSRNGTACWCAAPVQKRARAVIRRIAAALPPGKLEISGITPGICWDPAHLRRQDPDGLAHWDLPALLDFAAWTRRTLGPQWRITPVIPPPWDELPSLRDLFAANGFETTEENAPKSEPPPEQPAEIPEAP